MTPGEAAEWVYRKAKNHDEAEDVVAALVVPQIDVHTLLNLWPSDSPKPDVAALTVALRTMGVIVK